MINAYIDPICGEGSFFYENSFFSILVKLLVSVLLSFILGFERSYKRHSAGLRTFILVSLGGTLASIVDSSLELSIPLLSIGVVVGIAILSSNTLLYSSKSQIKGLTTSVALWVTSLMGVSVGFGYFTISLLSFLVIIIVMDVFPKMEIFFKDRSNHFEIHLELKNKTDLQHFTATLRKLGLSIDDIEANPAYINSGLSVYSISLTINKEELKEYKSHKEIIEALSSLDYVNNIEEIN